MNLLSPKEKAVMIDKSTEPPFSGEYDDFYQEGVYYCRQCDAPLFDSKAKFDAGCGWPAFDASFKDAIIEIPDPDGNRVEIICGQCKGHLGHAFRGEGYTETDTRHCVNSLSMKFVKS